MLPNVHEVAFDNGFRALLIERHNLPVVATTLWYRVGARDEHTGETGLSHFLEHMMFKGTGTYAKGEIDLLTSKMGGANNAFTDHDNTVYHFSLPAEKWQAALDIEADRMRGCALDPDEFAAEKSVVLEELAMGLDDPWSALFQAAEALAFQRHPYHRPIIGWREELERVGADEMRTYYERHYGAGRALFVIAGAIDVACTEGRLMELFGDQPTASTREPVVSEPDQDGERRATIHAPGNLTRIAMACVTCRIGEPEDLHLDLIGQVLGSGKNSRLIKRMSIDESMASHVSVHNDVRLDPGLFWVYAELHPGVDPAHAEAVMREEIVKFLDHGPTQDELRRAQIKVRSSLLFEDESVLGLALKIGRLETSAKLGYRPLATVEADYDAIRAEQMQATASKYFQEGSWSTVWSLPSNGHGETGEVQS